ncbi:hypothetical protein [Desulfolutivibrio sulfodismutans]|nr:hypothetical protein [Desulfolutivibrio sulfodismutans]
MRPPLASLDRRHILPVAAGDVLAGAWPPMPTSRRFWPSSA